MIPIYKHICESCKKEWEERLKNTIDDTYCPYCKRPFSVKIDFKNPIKSMARDRYPGTYGIFDGGL